MIEFIEAVSQLSWPGAFAAVGMVAVIAPAITWVIVSFLKNVFS